jgi:hypothetical protein
MLKLCREELEMLKLCREELRYVPADYDSADILDKCCK